MYLSTSRRHPEGPGSDLSGREDHPVVNVCHADALACARWCGKGLPSEAEWEFAARGGLDGMDFAWGEEPAPAGLHRANTWQSAFPHENRAEDGYAGTSPVAAYPANGYGLFDMIGNVWEWTEDWYAPRHAATIPSPRPCCLPRNPRGARWRRASTRWRPAGAAPRKVLKGASHLCAPSHCRRYRPAARHPPDDRYGLGAYRLPLHPPCRRLIIQPWANRRDRSRNSRHAGTPRRTEPARGARRQRQPARRRLRPAAVRHRRVGAGCRRRTSRSARWLRRWKRGACARTR
ncbi:SUMF1/EgtB/PvdO family nonheme iron enzyme [Ancylobacter dichloromethanicus]